MVRGIDRRGLQEACALDAQLPDLVPVGRHRLVAVADPDLPVGEDGVEGRKRWDADDERLPTGAELDRGDVDRERRLDRVPTLASKG